MGMRIGAMPHALALLAVACSASQTGNAAVASLEAGEPGRIGEGISLSQHNNAESALADSMLSNDASGGSTVRLFNTLFSTQTPGWQQQQQVKALPTKLGSTQNSANSAPSAAAVLQSQMQKMKTLQQQSEITKQLEEKLKKRVADSGQKLLVNEGFNGGTSGGWAAVIADMKKLPGSVLRSLPMEVDSKTNSISASDDALKGPVWYWNVPKDASTGGRFLGAMTDALGGKLTFEMKQSKLGSNEIIPSEGASDSNSRHVKVYNTFADVVLHGGAGKQLKRTIGFYFNRYPLTKKQPSASEWTKYTVPLKAVDGDPSFGKPWAFKTNAFDEDATDEHIKDVLSNLDTIMIRGRFQTGKQTTHLKNVYITGCPRRCKNGGEVLRDQCICKCQRGFKGEMCAQRIQYNFESITKEGHGVGKCLSVCRPKIKSTDSGQEIHLDCSEKHNSNYYASAPPVMMLTQCSGLSNQLFEYDGKSKSGPRYRSVSLAGFCLAAASAQVRKGLKQLKFDPISAPLSVVMCSKTNEANLWTQTEVRTMQRGVYRFALKKDGTDIKRTKTEPSELTSGMCIVPHIPWNRPCADKQCDALNGEAVRQAVLRDCDAKSNDNMFRFTASSYLLQREMKPTGNMTNESFKQRDTAHYNAALEKAMQALSKVQAQLQEFKAKLEATTNKEAKKRLIEQYQTALNEEKDKKAALAKATAQKTDFEANLNATKLEKKNLDKMADQKSQADQEKLKKIQQASKSGILDTEAQIKQLQLRLKQAAGSGAGSGSGQSPTLSSEKKKGIQDRISKLQLDLKKMKSDVPPSSLLVGL